MAPGRYHTNIDFKSSLFLSWYMYNINTQSYSVPWEGELVKQRLSSWYPEKTKQNKTHKILIIEKVAKEKTL